MPADTLPKDSAARKRFPLVTGLLDYFPDALAAVAEVSLVGNEKHNPGQPLHWSREKSADHADCVGRHLLERGKFDEVRLPDGRVFLVRHSAEMAWRSLALLQEELEQAGRSSAAGCSVSLPRDEAVLGQCEEGWALNYPPHARLPSCKNWMVEYAKEVRHS